MLRLGVTERAQVARARFHAPDVPLCAFVATAAVAVRARRSVRDEVREIADSGAASPACSEGLGGPRLGVPDDAAPLLRAVALAIVSCPRTALGWQGDRWSGTILPVLSGDPEDR